MSDVDDSIARQHEAYAAELKRTGGAAFPMSVQPDFQFANNGMTLRDYFAGQALQAILVTTSNGTHHPQFSHQEPQAIAIAMAEDAYDIADAMLKAREA